MKNPSVEVRFREKFGYFDIKIPHEVNDLVPTDNGFNIVPKKEPKCLIPQIYLDSIIPAIQDFVQKRNEDILSFIKEETDLALSICSYD